MERVGHCRHGRPRVIAPCPLHSDRQCSAPVAIKCQFVTAVPTGEQYEIISGTHRAVVPRWAPRCAASVEGRDVVRGFGLDEMSTAGRAESDPWPNRIRDGRYTFNGVSQQLALSEPARHNASHGLARYAPWVLVDKKPDAVTNRVRIRSRAGPARWRP